MNYLMKGILVLSTVLFSMIASSETFLSVTKNRNQIFAETGFDKKSSNESRAKVLDSAKSISTDTIFYIEVLL